MAIAVPAHWGHTQLWSLRNALLNSPNFSRDGVPARLISDAVGALTALGANPGIAARGVVALLDFGGSGTSITLADAASAFEPIGETLRYAEFSGGHVDQALLAHVVSGIGHDLDPAGTAEVGSLARLREECREAKERLSAHTATELVAELPGYRANIRLTRTELEHLIEEPLGGVVAAFEDMLARNSIGWSDLAALAVVGGGASIPLVTQRLSAHVPVVTTPQPAANAAVGAALFAAFGPDADAPTGLAVAAPVIGNSPADEPGSATFRALAWSQDDVGDEPVPYTGENPYDTGVTAGRPPVRYGPATGPIEQPRPWYRLPQLVVGLAAIAALIAIGGVAFTLTGLAGSTTATDPPSTAKSVAPTSAEPPPPPAPVAPPETVTVTSEPPPPAPPPSPVLTPTTTPPPSTTTRTTTTTTPTTTTTTPTTTTTTTTMTTTTTTTTTTTPTTTTTTTPTTTTTTTTTPAMTTTYLTVPFVPVPIPIQVPQRPFPGQ